MTSLSKIQNSYNKYMTIAYRHKYNAIIKGVSLVITDIENDKIYS